MSNFDIKTTSQVQSSCNPQLTAAILSTGQLEKPSANLHFSSVTDVDVLTYPVEGEREEGMLVISLTLISSKNTLRTLTRTCQLKDTTKQKTKNKNGAEII